MIAAVSHLVRLVCHANTIASTADLGLFPASTEDSSVSRKVDFAYAGQSGKAESVAESIDDWYGWLNQRGVIQGQLVFTPKKLPDWEDCEIYQLPDAYEYWSMILLCRDCNLRWTVNWTAEHLGDKDASDYETSWNVWYTGEAFSGNIPEATGSLEQVEHRLWNALKSALDYAKPLEHGVLFLSWLEQGLYFLQCDEKGLEEYFPDWTRIDASHQARRLLAAADVGWVFGGMMSWNDPWHEYDGGDSARYHAVSTELYDALCDAIVTATNSTINDRR